MQAQLPGRDVNSPPAIGHTCSMSVSAFEESPRRRFSADDILRMVHSGVLREDEPVELMNVADPRRARGPAHRCRDLRRVELRIVSPEPRLEVVPSDELQPVLSVLEEDGRADLVILFGSGASGNLRSDSDLDLAVRWTDDAARCSAQADMLTLLGKLGMAAGRDVHLIDIERAPPDLRRSILFRGRALLDLRPKKTRQLHTSTLIEYIDWEHARVIIDRGLDSRLGRSADHG